ncbi:hypothetical protein, partial [Pseudomonas aeruginosa]
NAEREMAAARDQLQMAADVARLGIWRWNLADDSLQWNERMCELYGQPLALRDGGIRFIQAGAQAGLGALEVFRMQAAAPMLVD